MHKMYPTRESCGGRVPLPQERSCGMGSRLERSIDLYCSVVRYIGRGVRVMWLSHHSPTAAIVSYGITTGEKH
ncbi:hypothetical protein J6590_037416 [Homalodisca vitripennis]|nr:hypothetical protein J6590_037416 [Homalodisca vitripennis]